MPKKNPIRVRLAKALLGSRAKEYIPALLPWDDNVFGSTGRLKTYQTKPEQLSANIGWCWTANNAIVEPTAAVEIKLYRKKKDGDREEIKDHEILDLLDNPNNVHTGEQQRQLHFTYMNFVGESYIYMRALDGGNFLPTKGKLPAALDIFPSHLVQFKLGDTAFSQSVVKYNNTEYPISSFIRDINPDPNNPYNGRSVVAAAATAIDLDNQMKEWNDQLFNNGAHPSLIFSTNEPLSDESFERWKQQFVDEHTGSKNNGKPLLIEGGDVKPYMLNPQDLDFLKSREFTRDEILAMWRVSPGIIGSVENVNRANLDAGFYIHAKINILPRIRQFVRQLNATLVNPYDSTLELDFENPVPEDMESKLNMAKAGVNNWMTIDEARDMYGQEPLADGLGEHIIIAGKTAVTLDSVVTGEVTESQDVTDPNADLNDPGDQNDVNDMPTKALAGVKKKPKIIVHN